MTVLKPYGKQFWAFSAGRIPMLSHGREPDFVSHDKLAILNTSDDTARLKISIFYEDHQPVGIYELRVEPARLRKIRINDLIDPVAVPLEKNYACYIQSSTPVIIQYSHMDTSSAFSALLSTLAYPVPDPLSDE